MTSRMKTFTRFAIRMIFLIAVASFFASCKTGSSVSDKGIVQKRKYQKGFYVNVKSPFDKKQKLEEKRGEDTAILAEVKSPQAISREKSIPQIKQSKRSDKVGRTKTHETITKSIPADEDHLKLEASVSKELQPDVFTKKHSFYNQNQIMDEATVSPQVTEQYQPQRINTPALLSFIFGILSLFIFGIPLGIAAIVCGIIGIVQINNNPELFRGSGFAIAGIIVGLISVVIVMLYLATLSAA